VVHLARSTRVENLDVVNGDYLLLCPDGAACYDRVRDTLHDIQREMRLCS